MTYFQCTVHGFDENVAPINAGDKSGVLLRLRSDFYVFIYLLNRIFFWNSFTLQKQLRLLMWTQSWRLHAHAHKAHRQVTFTQIPSGYRHLKKTWRSTVFTEVNMAPGRGSSFLKIYGICLFVYILDIVDCWFSIVVRYNHHDLK